MPRNNRAFVLIRDLPTPRPSSLLAAFPEPLAFGPLSLEFPGTLQVRLLVTSGAFHAARVRLPMLTERQAL